MKTQKQDKEVVNNNKKSLFNNTLYGRLCFKSQGKKDN